MSDAKRLIDVEDLYRLAAAEDPRLSPDGRWIAFVKMTRDKLKNTTRRAIWLVRPDGSGLRQFTGGDKQDHTPRWSPDGSRLAFVSTRNDKPQIYVIPVDGGEAQAITAARNGAVSPAWSPDGTQLAYLSPMRADEIAAEDAGEEPPPADKWEADQREARRKHAEEERIDPRVIERVPFRTGTEFWDERYSRVYVIPVEPDADGKRKPRRLTNDERDYGSPQWSADGQAIFSTASRKPDHDAPWMFQQIVRIAVADGALTPLTGEGANAYNPLPSPDGEWLAFKCGPDTLPLNRIDHLAVMPVGGGEIRLLTRALDREPDLYRWSVGGAGLVFTAGSEGDVGAYRVDRDGGDVKTVNRRPTRHLTGLDIGPDRLIAFTAFDVDGSHDLYVMQGAEERRLTDFNRAYLDEVQVAAFEEVRYTAPDGTPVQGWIARPPDYEAGRLYPLALNIHGGPAVMWGPAYPTMWLEWQHHAANGYVVFFCNPRGSTGYGETFTLANQGNWGNGPMSDILAGVDLMIARGLADPARLAITGGSYGGYMTAWIVGHDHRFAAAVTQRGVYHLTSFHGTTDIPILVRSGLEAEPWEDPAALWTHSPLAYADRITTPLLILHSDNDFRVPIAEAEQLFITLKRLGKTVQFVRYPREGHELSRSGEPRHIIDRLRRIVGWWDRYCKPGDGG